MDSHRRSTVAVNHDDGSLISPHLAPQLLSNLLFVTAAQLGGFGAFASQYDIHMVLSRAMLGGSAMCALWLVGNGQLRRLRSIDWSMAAFASLLLYLKNILLLYALSRTRSISMTMLLRYAPLAMDSLLRSQSKSRLLLLCSALFIPFILDILSPTSDAAFIWTTYTSLAAQLVLSGLYEYTRNNVTANSLAGTSLHTAVSTVGATACTLLASIPGMTMGWPVAVTGSTYLYFSTAVLLVSTTFHYPMSSKELAARSKVPYAVPLGLLVVLAFAGSSGLPSIADGVTAVCLFFSIQRTVPTSGEAPYGAIMRTVRSYLNSILANAESRKIFYFLVLNMCYMLVQMLYGIWTNSLGLISDAIHMAFDCMAIGVGLVASVMARWPPNERYTYGYSRIETLSGFSNGIFLILISVFIVFEAIQRMFIVPTRDEHESASAGEFNWTSGESIRDVRDGWTCSSCGGILTRMVTATAPQVTILYLLPTRMMITRIATRTTIHLPLIIRIRMTSRTLMIPDILMITATLMTTPIRMKQDMHIRTDERHPSNPSISVTKATTPLAIKKFDFDIGDTPLTPSYHFEHDDHLEHFHGQQQHPPQHEHEGHSHNMRGVFLHVLADTLGSVGVIISTLLIQFYGWTGFDPIASLFIAILIAASVVPLIVDTGKVLLLDIGGEARSIQLSVREIEQMQGVKLKSAMFWPNNDSSSVGSVHIK
ncbi:putative zinc transporter msc2 [Steccherinum ochraceum]|uniref:Putative zinc transporter msc2 n=1 Tax=Steccherinum ochraceum TaxID=92696 RepID=A0A4R0RMK1_9APHY|nr:putative zinc transporter msc2 [Steccherinum ochraceum]